MPTFYDLLISFLPLFLLLNLPICTVFFPVKKWQSKKNQKKNRKKEKKEKVIFTDKAKKYLSMVQGWRFFQKFYPLCSASSQENFLKNTTRPFTNIFLPVDFNYFSLFLYPLCNSIKFYPSLYYLISSLSLNFSILTFK